MQISSLERPELPAHSYGSTFIQQPLKFQRHDRRELFDEDEDDVEEYYPNSFLLPETLAPRVIGTALTPRGIPPAPVSSQLQPVAHIATTNPVVQALNESRLQNMQNSNLPRQQLPQHFPHRSATIPISS